MAGDAPPLLSNKYLDKVGQGSQHCFGYLSETLSDLENFCSSLKNLLSGENNGQTQLIEEGFMMI